MNTPVIDQSSKDAFGINYQSLELLGSVKGLFDNKKGIYYIVLGVVVGTLFIVTYSMFVGIFIIVSCVVYIAKVGNDRN